MANKPNSISKHLAQNVIQLRKKRGLSQGALAKLAGLPRSTVTYIESGQGNPSLNSLAKISGSLQVSIEELLSRPRANCKLIRSKDVPCQKRNQGAAHIFKLLPDPIPGMEIDRLEIEPGGRTGGVPHVSNTKEYLICMDGEVSVQVAGSQYSLKTGDVFAFPGDQPHSYQNIERRRTVCVSIVALAPHGI